MPTDFLNAPRSINVSDACFGLCDDQNEKPAYVDSIDCEKWCAVVDNKRSNVIQFTPVDFNIPLFRSDGNQDNSCDVMLICNTTLIFVELKDRTMKNKSWLSKAVKQLKSTVGHFKIHHDIQPYYVRYAYASNKRQINNAPKMSRKQRFRKETGFTLRVSRYITL